MRTYFYFVLMLVLVQSHAFAQNSFAIALEAEDSTFYSSYHDEPIEFSVTLANNDLQTAQQWNKAADEWLVKVTADYNAGKLTKEEFDKETKLVTEGKKQSMADTIGTHQLPWYQQLKFRVFFNDNTTPSSLPITTLGDPLTDAVAILNEDAYYQVNLHLSPEQVGSLKPGTYSIMVSLANKWSNTVIVEIKKQNIPPGQLKSRDVQLRFGNYYLQRNEANKALDYATAVLKNDPNDIGALVLTGKSYILKHNYKSALAYFEKALQQHRKDFADVPEEPLYLLRTIAWLKEKLK